MNQLLEYLKASPPNNGALVPQPWLNQPGNFVEWYWKGGRAYEQSVHANGWWVGSLLIHMETKEVVGVKIHLESFMPKPPLRYDYSELES